MSALLWYKRLVTDLFRGNTSNAGSVISKSESPEKIAIIDLSGETPREVSYQQLDELSDAVARALSNMNFEPQTPIAIIAHNSSDYIATYFGIMRAGMVAVLINHKLPVEHIKKLLKKNNVPFLFCDSLVRKNNFSEFNSVCFEQGFKAWVDRGKFSAFKPSKKDPAFLIFTSGSTSGEPKRVTVTHHQHIWLIKSRLPEKSTLARWIRSGEFRQILAAPLFHMGGLTNAETVLAGKGQMVLLPYFNATTFAKAIETYKPTSLKAVPPMLAMLLSNEELVSHTDMSSIIDIRLGGAPLSPALLSKIKQHFPRAKKVFNAYGSTELGAGLFQHWHPENKPVPELSVGYPRTGIEYRIVDGILHVKTPSLENFYNTNDLFYVDENGFYFCNGRADDMFISGGENIYPAEIETVLERHPDVESAVVIALDDEVKGSKPYAFVTLKQNINFDESKLKNFVLQNSPSYHLPRKIWQLQEIPLTLAFKIDRRALKFMAQELLNKI